MNYSKAGIILNTQKYRECTNFYKNMLGLKILHEIDRPGEQLTCFELGNCYLMVETGGNSYPGVKPIEQCPTKFRFNVSNIDAACKDLKNKGVNLEVHRHEWGMTAEFADPDGNRCALRSDRGFGI